MKSNELRKTALQPRSFRGCAPPRWPRAYKRFQGEDAEWLEQHALEIFVELSNAGQPIGKICSALLLTGMHYATEVTREG